LLTIPPLISTIHNSAQNAKNIWNQILNRHSPDGRSIQPPWWKNSAAGDNPKAQKRRISPPAHFGLPPIHGFATGKRHFAPLRGLSDAVLPSVGACGGTAWLNIATFALVEARRSFAECAGTDRTAPRPPPSGRSCSARGRQALSSRTGERCKKSAIKGGKVCRKRGHAPAARV